MVRNSVDNAGLPPSLTKRAEGTPLGLQAQSYEFQPITWSLSEAEQRPPGALSLSVCVCKRGRLSLLTGWVVGIKRDNVYRLSGGTE